MSLIKKLTSIKTKLTKLLSDCNTALVAKGATEVTNLYDVPTAIESVQSGGGVETIDDYDSYYTRPSWWLPYPELTEGENVEEIWVLVELEADAILYEDEIDVSNLEILPNGKKQIWIRIEGCEIETPLPNVIEIYANCYDLWYLRKPYNSYSSVSIFPEGSYYPKLQLISGTTMGILAQENNFQACGSLRAINCPVKMTLNSNTDLFSLSGLVKAPEIRTTELVSYMYRLCTSLIDGGKIGGEYGETVPSNVFMNCLNLEKIHICKPCFMTSSGIGARLYNLKYVTVDEGFSDSLYLYTSVRYPTEVLHAIIENLADLTGLTAKTLQIGSENIEKIDEEHKAMLNNKNWIYK